MWNDLLGGLPAEDFLVAVDPLLKGARTKLQGRYATSDRLAGQLAPKWAEKLGLRAGIPIPVGAFDAHWAAVGAAPRTGVDANPFGAPTSITPPRHTPPPIPPPPPPLPPPHPP